MIRKKAVHYPYQDAVTKILSKLVGAEVWAEVKFHEKRQWRFDYAIPEWKIAVEQDGGLYTGGRHSGGEGQLKDMEKMNEAAKKGWIVLHYTPQQFRHYVMVSEDIKQVYESKVQGQVDTVHRSSVHQQTQGTDKP